MTKDNCAQKSRHEEIELRPACNEDVPFLWKLRNCTVREHLENAGVVFKNDEQLEKVLYRLDCAQIITVDGADAGLFKCSKDSDPWKVIQIQVAPEHQGKGLGAKLLGDMLEEAWINQVSVELHVPTYSPARRLYEKLGFRVTSPDDTGFTMQKLPDPRPNAVANKQKYPYFLNLRVALTAE